MTRRPDDYTLVLEASTYAGSVALVRGGEVVAARAVEMRGRDEERLMPAVSDCVASVPEGIAGVSRVVCGAGPGSFTSLRIAGSIAKGICQARDLPLFQVSSMALVVAGSPAADAGGRFIVVGDAMRGESYVALFDVARGGPIPAMVDVRILPRSSVEEEARRDGAVILEGVPAAAGAARMLEAIVDAGPVDLAAWEPDYGRAAEAQVKWESAHGRPLPR